jgi:hypothetical protein
MPKKKNRKSAPKERPHGLAVKVGNKKKIEGADRFPYNAGTHACDCGITYNIFVDIPHYTSGPQFSKYLGKVLKIDHDNKRTHPDYINFPMEAEFTV